MTLVPALNAYLFSTLKIEATCKVLLLFALKVSCCGEGKG